MIEGGKSSAKASKKDFPEQKATVAGRKRADTREENGPARGFPENHRTLGMSL